MNVRIFVAGLLLFGAIGCTTAPQYNRPLASFDGESGYRFKNIPKQENSDDLFVILTFSGGGTRASALALGVLEKLKETQIEWHGRRCRLLDEVDVISGVSGGSFTAAYYGAFGDRVFADFDDYLYRNNNSLLLKAALAIPNVVKQASPFYSRTDTAAKRYAEGVFENRTFGDLMAHRPFIMLNATDMGLGRQFSFTQDYFDLLYSDLSSYPIGNAVAASSAYPGAFSALLLKNYPKPTDYRMHPWFQRWIDSKAYGAPQYRTAKDAESYTDPGKIYAHLSDGGVSDNLGLLPVLGALTDPDQTLGLVPTISADAKEQKIVVIVVNAAGRPPDEMSYKGEPFGLFKILSTAGATPMGWFTEAQVAYLQLLTSYMEQTTTTLPGQDAPPGTNAARVLKGEAPRKFYITEVGFEKFGDEAERKYYQTIPTSFTLQHEAIDKLRSAGGDLLDTDPAFQRLMSEIGSQNADSATN